jgi:hypothetical protein
VLIHVDGSAVADAISASTTAERSHACIENLLLAHFDGDHVVSLSPDDAGLLAQAGAGWSPRARRAIEHIDQTYPQIAGLREDVRWSMELGLGLGFDGCAHAVAGGRWVIRAHLHALYRAPCAALLGENQTDAKLFRQLGLAMRAVRGWENVAMVLALHGGGGDTTVREFQAIADRGTLLLAVADTDQSHPGSAVGGTYRKLADAARERPAHQRVRPLPVRTAEALVPLDVYREVLTSPERLTGLDRIEQLLRSAPADILRFAHLKDGLRLFQVEHPANEEEGRYWAERARSARRDRCNRSVQEQCTKRSECGCYVLDALGGDALVLVVAWMEQRKSKKQVAARLQLRDRPDTAELADEVLSWGLALPPLQT